MRPTSNTAEAIKAKTRGVKPQGKKILPLKTRNLAVQKMRLQVRPRALNPVVPHTYVLPSFDAISAACKVSSMLEKSMMLSAAAITSSKLAEVRIPFFLLKASSPRSTPDSRSLHRN